MPFLSLQGGESVELATQSPDGQSGLRDGFQTFVERIEDLMDDDDGIPALKGYRKTQQYLAVKIVLYLTALFSTTFLYCYLAVLCFLAVVAIKTSEAPRSVLSPVMGLAGLATFCTALYVIVMGYSVVRKKLVALSSTYFSSILVPAGSILLLLATLACLAFALGNMSVDTGSGVTIQVVPLSYAPKQKEPIEAVGIATLVVQFVHCVASLAIRWAPVY